MTYELKQYPDGLYFDMPFTTYLAQDAFSTSRVNAVNDSVLAFWTDEIEPTLAPDFDLMARVEEDTEAMAEGRAWHVMALEGKEAFDKLYATDYDPDDYPDAIKAKDEYLDACHFYLSPWHVVLGLDKDAAEDDIQEAYRQKAEIHHPDKGGDAEEMKRVNVARDAALSSIPQNLPDYKKSWSIAKLQEVLTMAGAPVKFHSVLKAEHVASCEGKYLLTAGKMAELRRAGEVMRAYKLDDDFLTGGFPEVSIIVTINGVRYKCRVDYLKPDMQVEYKTLSRRNKKMMFDEVCAKQMHDFGYFAGAYIYSICVEAARDALIDDLSFAHGLPKTQESTDWIDAFISGKSEYWFFFQERGKYNHVLPRRFDKYDEVTQSRKIQRIWQTGKFDVEHAVKEYNRCMDEFGRENIWLPTVHAKPWDDMDFKPYMIVE